MDFCGGAVVHGYDQRIEKGDLYGRLDFER